MPTAGAWRLPTTIGPVPDPGRSPDGDADRPKIELRDLVDGTTRSWPAPGDPQRSNGSIRGLLSFSEDETELLAWVSGRTHGWAALIDLSSGDLVRSRVNAHPIGVTDNGDVVTLRASDDALTVVVLDHTLSEVRRFQLTPTDGWTAEPRERGRLTPAGELMVSMATAIGSRCGASPWRTGSRRARWSRTSTAAMSGATATWPGAATTRSSWPRPPAPRRGRCRSTRTGRRPSWWRSTTGCSPTA